MKPETIETAYHSLLDSGVALGLFELADRTRLPIEELQPALNALCADGRAAITKKGKYAPPELMGLIAAKSFALRNGTPMARPLSGAAPMKILPRGKARCMPDDIVLVRAAGGDECELVTICSRGKAAIPAFIRVEQRQLRHPRGKKRDRRRGRESDERIRVVTATPCDRRIAYPIVITGEEVPVCNDEIALVAIETYPEGDRPIFARVERVLGDRSDMATRLKVISESHDFPTAFPQKAEVQCRSLPEGISPEEFAGREDLRSLTVFTIDGPFSKDFDDAISLDRTPDGDWRLGVHIADVSHFVRPGSAVDREALERGTSLYLPGLTVPMLPERLSNDLCSLMPGVDRLAMSLFMTIRDGKTIDHHLAPSVIHSRARLTYDAVNRFFDGDDSCVDASLHEALREMLALSHQLRKRRAANGCIELDVPEAEFVLDEENVPTDILIEERGESERLIEDFMLAANETVALLARTTFTPLIYRIHEDPDSDRLRELEQYLDNLGVHARFGDKPHPGQLQQVLEDVREHPAADTIRRMLLRSMQRAQYSEEPLGHYALAMRDYCHFTSPIRRYPDLVVHRMLKRMLRGGDNTVSEGHMEELARQSSAREQEATLAERESADLLKARYMSERVGKKYNGIVSGITSWGMYVTLPNTVEGLVHIATLDDYYDYDREKNHLISIGSGNVFRLGDRVRIRMEYADLERGTIDFSLIGREIK